MIAAIINLVALALLFGLNIQANRNNQKLRKTIIKLKVELKAKERELLELEHPETRW